MSVVTFTIPKEYGYVLGVALFSIGVTSWQTLKVGAARKAAKIGYPRVYATVEEEAKDPAARIFNCTQRAHQNTLEVMPGTILTLLISGLRYPTIAASFGAIAMLGRIVYTIGYTTGNPSKRSRGSFEYIGRVGLLVTAGLVALQIITSGL